MVTYDVVEADGPALEDDLAREAAENGEPELDDVETDVLVERVENELGEAAVAPRAVHEQQPVQVLELKVQQRCHELIDTDQQT